MLTTIVSMIATIVAAIYTAFILPLLQDYLKTRVTQYNKQREEEESNRKKINLTYLNPLRLWLEENYVRISEILVRFSEEGECKALLFIDSAEDVSSQDADWFNGKGCYLISSCYLTACLFFSIKQVRDNIPYLRLGKGSDTELLTLMFHISHAFLRHYGVFYVTQPSIGNDMLLREENRLVTYREFCQTLQNPEKRVWFDRLINFYIETGKGKNIDRIKSALKAIKDLSEFLDESIGQGTSIEERLRAEGIPVR